jgi:hypothetical protein
MQDTRPGTDPCPPPAADDEPEQTRLARAAATGFDNDSPPDKALEDLAAQTADAFGVPYVLVSLTLDEGHWFKSHTRSSEAPLDSRRPPFDASFCKYVVESGQPVLVSDATMHPIFATNPLVRSGIVTTFASASSTRGRDPSPPPASTFSPGSPNASPTSSNYGRRPARAPSKSSG